MGADDVHVTELCRLDHGLREGGRGAMVMAGMQVRG